MTRWLLVLLLRLWTYPTLAGQALPAAPDFSAEVVETIRGDARPQVKKVYVHGTHMRIIDATPEQKNEGDYMLIDYAARTAYAVMPLQKAYIDMSKMAAEASEVVSRFFHPRNPEDACPDWMQLAQREHESLTCKRVGREALNGRTAVKYEGVSGNSKKGFLWVDMKLGFVVKMQDPDSLTVWQNIREEPQPASLFVIPADYRKTDIEHMMGPGPPKN